MGKSVSILGILLILVLNGAEARAGLAGLPKTTALSPFSPSYNAALISPVFTDIDMTPFQRMLAAYHAHDIPLAIMETNNLKMGKTREAEAAAFFLGELYLIQADRGDKEAISQAMVSFQEAIRAYPQSKHLLWGYLQEGKIYARQNLFYEAIGSFTRILERPHSKDFAWKVGVEKAKTYRAWGKWLDAKAVYEDLLQWLPREKKTEVMFGYADVLYQIGRYEQAYYAYKEAAAVTPAYRFQDPIALFQFGEAAYRSGRLQEAQKRLLDFYNIHPHAPLATFALIRAGTLFSTGEKGVEPRVVTPNLTASHTFRQVARTAGENVPSESFHLGRILLSLEALKKCDLVREVPQKDPFLADTTAVCNMPLKQEAFLPSQWEAIYVQEIRTHALALLKENAPSTTAQGALLETIHQLRRYRALDVMAEIEAALLVSLPPISPYRFEIQTLFNETIKEWAPRSEPVDRVALFHAYPLAFTKKMMNEDIGFVMGMSHIQVGLLSKAADLLHPVADNYKHPLSDEALYQLGQVFLQRGENERAQRAFEQYQRRSVSGRYRALADLGDVAFKQNRIEEAVRLYQHWLEHHPHDPAREAVYAKISDVHRFRSDFDSEIAVYLQWMRENPQSANLPYMRLSDAYFQAGQYEKAATTYQWMMDHAKEGQDKIEWIQLRLGQSYVFMGDTEKGRNLFMAVSKNGKDALIRKMAAEHLRSTTASLPRPLPAGKGRL